MTYGQFGQVTESEPVKCVTTCVGDSLQYCGGPDRNFVYYVRGTLLAFCLFLSLTSKFCPLTLVRRTNDLCHVTGTFGAWQYAKPNNNDYFQTCSVFQIRFTGGQIKMDDDDCYKSYSYICDIRKYLFPPRLQSNPNSSPLLHILLILK